MVMVRSTHDHRVQVWLLEHFSPVAVDPCRAIMQPGSIQVSAIDITDGRHVLALHRRQVAPSMIANSDHPDIQFLVRRRINQRRQHRLATEQWSDEKPTRLLEEAASVNWLDQRAAGHLHGVCEESVVC